MRRNRFFKNTKIKKDNWDSITVNADSDLIPDEVSKALNEIKITMGHSTDIVTREFKIGKDGSIDIGIAYMDGLADKVFVQDSIIEPLKVDLRITQLNEEVVKNTNLFDVIKDFSLANGDMKEITDLKELYTHFLSGDTIVFIGGYHKGFAVSTRGGEGRGVQEPSSQTVVRGPKDGFTETLRTNTSLVRRRIKNTDLWIETIPVGKKSQTDVAILYLKDVANPKIVNEIRTRIKRIDIDAVLESGYIEEMIQDETFTVFPTIHNSERPDAACAAILEGKIVIMVDGTPFVLIAPAVFVQFFQSSEDYYQRADISSLLRMLRFFCLFLALITPSAYIAVTTFHQEMLPTLLLISLAAQREGVPFPALVEALMMEITFEILREAGVRMPRAVGSAISIVGALVLGQAAVEAGIVSATMVIIVSLTAIASFVCPSFNMAISIRMLRFIFMILAATFGLFGIIMGLIIMVAHLASLRSFGVPYLSPMAPLVAADQKDVLVRAPIWKMITRPSFISRPILKEKKLLVLSHPINLIMKVGLKVGIIKKTALLMLSFLMLIGLTGCWSSHELSELAIATGLGIDKTDDGYRVSVQFVNPGEIAAKKGSSGVPISVHTAEGNSILEAVRKLTTTAPRKVYLAHVRVIIFGEELAKEGIRKPLDFLSRDHEMRADFVIAIAKGLKAEELISVLTPMEKVSANKIFSSIETSEKNWAPTKIVLLDELIAALVSDGKQPVITGIYLIGDSESGSKISNIQQVNTPTKIKSDYLGVFKGDTLVGWLNEPESKGFNYITDNITSTVGFIDCDGGGTLTIETIRSKTKLEGAVENGRPKIKIHVSVESNIGDVECSMDLTKSETIKEIERKFNEKTKTIIMSSVERAKELGTDIYGFGEAIGRTEPKKWENLKKNWNEEFLNTDVEVDVDLKIRRVGTIFDSFQEEEKDR